MNKQEHTPIKDNNKPVSKKKSKYFKSEKIKKHYLRTFYYSFCISFIIFGLLAIGYFLYSNDKNIFGFSTKYYEEAIAYAEQGRLEDAEETLYACIEYDPNYADARLMLIDILIDENKYDKALELVEDSIALHDRNENYYIQYIKALTGQNRITEAMDFIEGISANYIVVKLSEKRPANFVSAPDPGTYDSEINVVFETSDNSDIYYTLDGSMPNLNSHKYTGEAITVSSGTQTLRAFAINNEGLISDEYTATYRIYKSNTPYLFKDEKVEAVVRAMLNKATGTIVYGDLEKILNFKNTVAGSTLEGKIYSLEDLNAMENLSSVELYGEDELSNIEVLSTLKNVKSITLSGCAITDELLDRLESMIWLESLDLSDNFISDVSAIASLIKLKSLNVSENIIKDISALSGTLNNLQALDISNNMLSDLTPMSGFSKLKVLNVSENLIEDISPISSLSLLTELDLSYNYVSNLDGISRLPQITTLNLSGTQVTTLSKISSYTKLINLNISETAIDSLAGITEIPTLSTLNISSTAIRDYAPLLSMNIKNLTAANNEISSLHVIAGISTLEVLDVSNNLIVDLEPLTTIAHLTNLNIQGNFPMNLSTLTKCTYLTMVNCSNTTVSAADISSLEKNGIIVIRTAAQEAPPVVIPEDQE